MKLKSYLLPAGMLAAGCAALFTGLLPWPAFQELAARTVPVLAFVVAMSLVTEMVDDAGLFRVVTERLAALGRGRVFLLWLLVVGLATVSTVFLSLDTTAVLVTPVVVLLAVHARIPPLPFALTTIWLANTASLLLPVSNLTNLLAQDRLNLSPAAFAEPRLGAGAGGHPGADRAPVAGVPEGPVRPLRAAAGPQGAGQGAAVLGVGGHGAAAARARLRRARAVPGDGRGGGPAGSVPLAPPLGPGTGPWFPGGR